MAFNKKKLRKRIRSVFKNECSVEEAGRHSRYVEAAIKLGIKTDADAIAFVIYENNELSAALHVGSSVLFGSDIWDYLLSYHSGSSDDANQSIDWVTDQALDQFAKDGIYSATPLKDLESERWRSFKVVDGKLLSSDQIKSQSVAMLN